MVEPATRCVARNEVGSRGGPSRLRTHTGSTARNEKVSSALCCTWHGMCLCGACGASVLCLRSCIPYRTVLHCTVLYRTVLHCTVLYRTVQERIRACAARAIHGAVWPGLHLHCSVPCLRCTVQSRGRGAPAGPAVPSMRPCSQVCTCRLGPSSRPSSASPFLPLALALSTARASGS
eukprot:3122876-Pyramimonas_sp.AAC.1